MGLTGVIVVEDLATNAGDPFSSVPAVEHVANRPIAHHVMDALTTAGAREVVVASSSRSAQAVHDCVRRADLSGRVTVRFVEQDAPLEFASALNLVAPVVEDAACIVHAAGGLLGEPLAPIVDCLGKGSDAVMTVHRSPAPGEQLSSATQAVLGISKFDSGRSPIGVAGVWAFGPGAVGRAAAESGFRNADLTSIAKRLTTAGGTIQVRLTTVWRAYHGAAVDLLELNSLLLDQIQADLPPVTRNDNRIEGRVMIDKRASVTDSVLIGPVVIGPDARISEAYIGPYTAVGAGARIEGAEVERSIICAGASVTHVGRRLTASVVGRDARVFHDFSLPRALRLRVGIGTEVGLC